MSSSNQVALRFDPETAFGIIDSGPPKFQDMLFTNESLKGDTSTARSQQINSDRMVADIVRTDVSVTGDIAFELAGATLSTTGNLEQFILAALQAPATAFAADISEAGITLTTSAGNTLTRSAGDWTGPLSLVDFDWIYVTGFTNAVNNGFFRIIDVLSTTVLTLDTTELVAEGPVGSCTAEKGDDHKNAATFKSYSIEKEFTDIATTFQNYRGCVIDQMTCNTNVRNIVEGSFTILGAQAAAATATVGDGSPTAAPNHTVANAIDHASIQVGTTVAKATQFSFTLGNAHRMLPVIGTLGADSATAGSFTSTGRFQKYLAGGQAQITQYLAFTTTNLAIRFNFGGVNDGGMVFHFPSVKFTSGQAVTPGLDDDVIADLEFEAFKDPLENCMCRIISWDGIS